MASSSLVLQLYRTRGFRTMHFVHFKGKLAKQSPCMHRVLSLVIPIPT